MLYSIFIEYYKLHLKLAACAIYLPLKKWVYLMLGARFNRHE